MNEIFEGGCFCGAIDCQHQTGGAFAINALIETDRIEIVEGKPVPAAMKTDSGYPHEIHRCSACQTALWSDYGGRKWMIFVRVSTLERRAEFSPDVHIFTRSKVPWVRLPEYARVFEEYYSTKALWPPESLARREAARIKAGAAR